MSLLRGTGLLCERLAGATEISVHPARKDQRPGRTCVISAQDVPSDPLPPGAETQKHLQEIRVLARRSLGTALHFATELGSSVTSYDDEQIRLLSAQTVSDLLETQNFQGGPTQDTHYGSAEAAANSGLAMSPNLRGVGARSTLVLFNGHPVAASGNDASFRDLLPFPLAAITKVSVMHDGASALYGSDAVGGVINIDTRDHYSRPESHVEVGELTDGHQERNRFSQELGTYWDGGSALVIAELMRWDTLPASARWQANTARVPYADPGNLVTQFGTYPIPAGQAPQPLDFSTLVSGPARLVNPALESDILPSQKRWAFYGSLEQELTPSITFWSNALWTERNAREALGGQQVFLDVTQSPFLLHAPPGPVSYEYNLLKDIGPQVAAATVHTLNASMALHVKLPRKWNLVVSESSSLEAEAQVTTGTVDQDALQAAAFGPKETGFNPFSDNSSATLNVLSRLDVPKRFDSRSRLWSYEVTADGPLLGENSIRGSVGIEARDQRFAWSISHSSASNDLRRQLYATYSEVQLSLLDADFLTAPLRNFAVSLAGRIEHYSDFGHAATPRVGFSWLPVNHIALRGAWSRSIRAPDLGDLSQRENSSYVQPFNGVPALIWSGGNPELTVERARTRTLGIELDSGTLFDERLSFELGYFDILSNDRIEQELPTEDILTNPQYSSFITLPPNYGLQQYVCNNSTFIGGTRESCRKLPTAAIVDLRLRNAGVLWTDGLDLQAGVSKDTDTGNWGLNLAGTYILHYRQATLPGASTVSALNTESHPLALHVLATASWVWGGARADATWRYANGYRNNEIQPASRVGSWATTDLRLAYTFDLRYSAGGESIEVAVFGKNILDRYPPFSNNVAARVGYDEENGDLTGRVIAASVHVKW